MRREQPHRRHEEAGKHAQTYNTKWSDVCVWSHLPSFGLFSFRDLISVRTQHEDGKHKGQKASFFSVKKLSWNIALSCSDLVVSVVAGWQLCESYMLIHFTLHTHTYTHRWCRHLVILSLNPASRHVKFSYPHLSLPLFFWSTELQARGWTVLYIYADMRSQSGRHGVNWPIMVRAQWNSLSTWLSMEVMKWTCVCGDSECWT